MLICRVACNWQLSRLDDTLSNMKGSNQLKAWMPLLICMIVAAAGLVLPLALATANPETWGAAGWVLYLYIVPACIILLLIGAWASLSQSLKARDHAMAKKQPEGAPPAHKKGCFFYAGKSALILMIVLIFLFFYCMIFVF